jgi:hypothetical protein
VIQYAFFKEHLNIILMSIAQLYHTAKRQANLTSYVTGGIKDSSNIHWLDRLQSIEQAKLIMY